MDELAPVFVKISDYKEILDIIDVIKSKISSTKETLQRIKDLKNEEDEEILSWSKNLDEISNKIAFIDKAMFQPNIQT
jgi:hypothetical protein